MAASCLPSKTGSTSPKDSSLLLEQTQDHKTSKTQPYSVWTTGHTQSLQLTLKSRFFQHFRNMRAGNTPRANHSGFGKWGTWRGLQQFTKPEHGETNLQDLGKVPAHLPLLQQHPARPRSAGRADAVPGTADFHRSGAQLSEDTACVHTPAAAAAPACRVNNQSAEAPAFGSSRVKNSSSTLATLKHRGAPDKWTNDKC